jgi:hypothetical protein
MRGVAVAVFDGKKKSNITQLSLGKSCTSCKQPSAIFFLTLLD